MKAEDTLHKDDELEAAARRTQETCARAAAALVNQLQVVGFDVVVVRLGKIVRGKNGECALPGATASAVQPSATPCLLMEAGELRRIAEKFEAEFQSAAPKTEAYEGYSRDADPKDYGL